MVGCTVKYSNEVLPLTIDTNILRKRTDGGNLMCGLGITCQRSMTMMKLKESYLANDNFL
jgi:hypothetical protein